MGCLLEMWPLTRDGLDRLHNPGSWWMWLHSSFSLAVHWSFVHRAICEGVLNTVTKTFICLQKNSAYSAFSAMATWRGGFHNLQR